MNGNYVSQESLKIVLCQNIKYYISSETLVLCSTSKTTLTPWVSSIVLVVDVTLKKTTFPMSFRGGRSRAQWCSPGTSGRSAASVGPWRGPPWRRWGTACTIQSPCCSGQAPPIGCEPCPWNTYGPSGRSSPKQSAVGREDSEAYRQLDTQTYK